ncbi:D-lactate dehydrogenase [Acetobacter sacchari]|uniref:D-lactate dehydrogenase n=1 Tax=Acetobacter sacchari TaxID=2661687 RepID=UPI0038CFB583
MLKSLLKRPRKVSNASRPFIQTLERITGAEHVLTDPGATAQYRRGYRFGDGKALAVVRPGSLLEQWRVLQACVAADKIVLMQAANTGLTGGSTPDGDGYDRDIVIISGMRMKTISVIGDGRQVVCLPGATLDQLERTLAPLGREPHSVIGSSCLGAGVFGGVSNNSGGSLVQRGPVFTEMSLFAQVGEDGALRLVNHLGVDLGSTPEEILTNADQGRFPPDAIRWDAGKGHDDTYRDHVRDVDADTPARFNADPRHLFEGAGCAGRVALFAVRLDTFPADRNPAVFYIGTNSARELEDIRRHILTSFTKLPIAGEYMHRDAFNIAETYGKDTFLIIRAIGTRRLPAMFALKNRFDRLAEKLPFLPAHSSDRLLQWGSSLFPQHLPQRMLEYRDRFEHHLMLKVEAGLVGETAAFLQTFKTTHGTDYFQCTPDEGSKAFLHRFAAAGAAIRYRSVHTRTVEDIVALDIALRRNDQDWFETLPEEIDRFFISKLYYGHFLCHVMHQDYIVRKGNDCVEIEHRMLPLYDARGARYPAEHNYGHLYEAPPELASHYRTLDPCNCFNPGLGKTTKARNWKAESAG